MTSGERDFRQAVELAKPWQAHSTTLLVVSDGDTIPDSGAPELPRSIHRALIADWLS